MTVARAARAGYLCSECGVPSPKWQGRCPSCAAWNSLVEGEPPPRGGRASWSPAVAPGGGIVSLDSALHETAVRRPSGIGEWDRALGGATVTGSLVLLGGDPGVGKSTLALHVAHRTGSEASPSLYCSGEESAQQLAMRARRIGCAGPEVAVSAETDLDAILAAVEARRPPVAVVDSVQTVHDPSAPGAPGSVPQVRSAVMRLLLCAKTTGVPILLVGHVTKDGAIAGPRTLEHMVDVVLYLEGERHGEHRLLRGLKNRFGTTGEVGVFVMGEAGMAEAEAPGRALLEEASLGIPGSVLTVTCEGARPLAVEVQALVAGAAGLPRRAATGFDGGRLHLLLAVLEARGGLSFGAADVYLNAVGGVRLGEPAVDLAAALAIAGCALKRAIPEGCAVVGELGLAGEIRRVRRLEARLLEAHALGVRSAVVPASQAGSAPAGMTCLPVRSVTEALRLLA